MVASLERRKVDPLVAPSNEGLFLLRVLRLRSVRGCIGLVALNTIGNLSGTLRLTKFTIPFFFAHHSEHRVVVESVIFFLNKFLALVTTSENT